MDPLSASTRSFLDDAVREEGPSSSDRRRLWSALAASVVAGSPSVAHGHPADPKLGVSGENASPSPSPSPSPSSSSEAASFLDRAVRLRHVLGVAALVFVGGLVVGRVTTPSAHTASSPRSSSTVPVSSDPTPSAASALSSPVLASTANLPATTATDAPTASTIAAPRLPPIATHAPTVAKSADVPLDEVATILRAKRSLDEGRTSEALASLEAHERAFPHGNLAEERDALRVLALCAGGRVGEGREERARFLREHPLSAYADRVRAACATGDAGPPASRARSTPERASVPVPDPAPH